MHEVRWGIIGCGNVTEVKSGPGFQKAERSRLVAVMRRNPDLARDYAARHGVPKWYHQASDLIQDPDVDAVYVATPPAFHKEYTIAALRAGKPVYVEKPMARTHEECLEMVDFCKAVGVPLYVAYYRRALPRFLKIRELINSGAIGEPRVVHTVYYRAMREMYLQGEAPWRVVPEVSGGGLLFDLASHTLDALDFLLGPIVSVQGTASNQAGQYDAEDVVSGTYRFASGVHGTGMWCFSAYGDEDVNVIVGTKGKISFSTFGDDAIRLTKGQGAGDGQVNDTIEFAIVNPVHIQQPMIQTVTDAILGLGECDSTGVSGARTSWVMDELVRDYYRGGRRFPS